MTRRAIAHYLRSPRRFPIRGVVAALRALADDVDTIASGTPIWAKERVDWLRKSEVNAHEWWLMLHIVLDRTGLSGADLRELADQYASVMATRRTPIRKITASGARIAPLLPPALFHVKQPDQVDRSDPG